MKEYIEREAAKNILRRHQHRFTCADEANGYGSVKWSEDVIYAEKAINCMDAIPAADVREVVRGKWEYTTVGDEEVPVVAGCCSACHGYKEEFPKWIYDDGGRIWYNFCPICGADMT